MASNNLSAIGIAKNNEIKVAHITQLLQALSGAFVPRGADGTVNNGVTSLGTPVMSWHNLYLTGGVYVNGAPLTASTSTTNTVTDGNALDDFNSNFRFQAANQPFAVKAGVSGPSSTIMVTVATDIKIDSFTTAATTANTADVVSDNYQNAPDIRTVHVSNVGSSWLSLVDQRCAFFAGNAIYTGILKKDEKNNYSLTHIHSSFFTKQGNRHISAGAITGQLTIGKIAHVFTDGVDVFLSYNEPTVSRFQPANAQPGDYWFDIASKKYQEYNGSVFSPVSRIYVGSLIINTTDIAAVVSVQKTINETKVVSMTRNNNTTHYIVKKHNEVITDTSGYNESSYFNGTNDYLYLLTNGKLIHSSVVPLANLHHPFMAGVAIGVLGVGGEVFSISGENNDYLCTGVRTHVVTYNSAIDALKNGFLLLDGSTVKFSDIGHSYLWTRLHSVIEWYNSQITDANTSHNICTNYTPNVSITTKNWDDTFATAANDRGGLAIYQGDAIRNITGLVHSGESGMRSATGAFALNNLQTWHGSGYSRPNGGIDFDASRVVPTASRNRPQNHNIGKHWALYIL